MNPPNPVDELLAERLSHTIDLLRAEIRELRAEVEHQRELNQHRLTALEADTADHEQRLRAATEGVTQFKMFSGLAAGSSTIASVIALIKVFLSP